MTISIPRALRAGADDFDRLRMAGFGDEENVAGPSLSRSDIVIASAAAVASSSIEALAMSSPVSSLTIVWKFNSASRRPWEISAWYGVYCVYQPGFSRTFRWMTGGVMRVVITLPMNERKTLFSPAIFLSSASASCSLRAAGRFNFFPSRIFWGTAASMSPSRLLLAEQREHLAGFGGVRADVAADKLVGVREIILNRSFTKFSRHDSKFCRVIGLTFFL